MNIKDVNRIGIEVPPNVWEAIFIKQLRLMEKYEPIEKRNGAIVPDHVGNAVMVMPDGSKINFPCFAIDDAKTQMRLKDMFWRATEEFAEALENTTINMSNMRGLDESTPNEVAHVYEELIDALHFLVEASIIGGLHPAAGPDVFNLMSEFSLVQAEHADTPLPPIVSRDISLYVWPIIRSLGLAANTLKNKPWKQSQMLTDRRLFLHWLKEAWTQFMRLVLEVNLTEADVFILYTQKNEVNKFRQRSNY